MLQDAAASVSIAGSINFTNLAMFGVVRSQRSLLLSSVHDC